MDIPDAHLFTLKTGTDQTVLLSEGQHILRRFGQIESRTHKQGDVIPFTRRTVADEIWVPLSGSAIFHLHDLRPDSPSFKRDLSVELDSNHPSGLLIPFGVAYAYRIQREGILLRISTHADDTHPEDELPIGEDLSDLLDIE